MKIKVIGVATVLAIDILVLLNFSAGISTFRDGNLAYKDYLALCFLIIMSCWFIGRVASWYMLRRKQYRWMAVVSALIGHSILGLLPLTIYITGKKMRGVGETGIFELGPWNAVVDTLNHVDIHQGHWAGALNAVMHLWLFWVLCALVSFVVAKYTFGQTKEIT